MKREEREGRMWLTLGGPTASSGTRGFFLGTGVVVGGRLPRGYSLHKLCRPLSIDTQSGRNKSPSPRIQPRLLAKHPRPLPSVPPPFCLPVPRAAFLPMYMARYPDGLDKHPAAKRAFLFIAAATQYYPGMKEGSRFLPRRFSRRSPDR